MLALAPPPKFRALTAGSMSSAPLPLVGGKLYSYAAGTTTPQATYTDATGTTPNPNPTVLDARGEADVWLGLGAFKLVLTDAAGVVQWTTDNILSAEQLAADLAGQIAEQGEEQGAYTDALRADLANQADVAKGAALVGFDPALAYAAGTVGGDLNAPRPVARGGTGAATAGGALQNLGLIDVTAPLFVQGTLTLTAGALGREIVFIDSGTPVNYVITLPPAAPVGTLIFLRVSRDAAKVYGVNGNDVTIDGAGSRNMWRGESALLLKEAGRWTKLSGVTIAFSGGMLRTTSQPVSVASHTQAVFNQPFGDPSGLNICYSTAGSNFQCPRSGNYLLAICSPVSGDVLDGVIVQLSVGKNAGSPTSPPSVQTAVVAGPGNAVIVLNAVGVINFVSGDAAGMHVYVSTPAVNPSLSTIAGVQQPTLTYAEIPSW